MARKKGGSDVGTDAETASGTKNRNVDNINDQRSFLLLNVSDNSFSAVDVNDENSDFYMVHVLWYV